MRYKKKALKKLSRDKKLFGKTDWKHGFPDFFYQDIKIAVNNAKEIKDPWELSRFQDLKNSETFYKQIDDWIDQNSFLIGVNWVCPMEVAIRAINWVLGFYSFKNSKSIPKTFWPKFINSLHEHAFYLKNNWETSDKPNNHYISDLVGYFYLSIFFKNTKEICKTYKKILEQFDHQINSDGTSYEGSTSYHKLDTELFWHFYIVCKAQDIALPKNFETKLKKMFMFLYDTDSLQIGDNDSGKIYTGLKVKKDIEQKDAISHYPDFGLTIVKKNNFEISFRHPTFNKKQPTGHFHKDELSVTLSFKNVPILIDPGSYIYTSNKFYRNLFRSYQSHNTFYKPDEKEIDKNIDLFQLPKQEQKDTAQIIKNKEFISVQNFYNKRTRKVTVFKDSVKIEDFNQDNSELIWNFIFHPEITLHKLDDYTWKISHPQVLLKLSTKIKLTKEDGFYSPRYGVMQRCSKLICEDSNKAPSIRFFCTKVLQKSLGTSGV